MLNILIFIAGTALAVQAFIGLTYFISSVWEKGKRATVFGGLQFLGMLGLFALFLYLKASGFFETGPGLVILVGGVILGALACFLLLRRTAPNKRALEGTNGLVTGEAKRYDEREIVFARNRCLAPGSEQYGIFYREHPEYEEYDAARRQKGGPLGIPGTIDQPGHGPNVAATLGSVSIPVYLSAPDKYNPLAHPMFGGKKAELSPGEAAERVKGYTLNLGADLVGITEINPSWVYSHRGEIFHKNWEDWGKEIQLAHRYAVVFAVEMFSKMVAAAPHTPTTIESMRNYAKGASIATQLAAFIANLGYSATANHLRHYDALLVPLAVDAGLGELGRIGYLVTKELGPRVRLGAVTTGLPLIPDKPVDIGIEAFCRVCNKCAICCPSGSIPSGDQAEVNGTLRWKLNEETCFAFWGKIGTDCNVCMRVCPWSHARTFPHKLIVELVSRNVIAGRLFTVMDDVFYGKRPRPKAPPGWAKFDGEGR